MDRLRFIELETGATEPARLPGHRARPLLQLVRIDQRLQLLRDLTLRVGLLDGPHLR